MLSQHSPTVPYNTTLRKHILTIDIVNVSTTPIRFSTETIYRQAMVCQILNIVTLTLKSNRIQSRSLKKVTKNPTIYQNAQSTT